MALEMSDYEKRRLENLADNKRVLALLGLMNPLTDKASVTVLLKKRKVNANNVNVNGDHELNHRDLTEPPRKRPKKCALQDHNDGDGKEYGSINDGVRRSARKQGNRLKVEDDCLPDWDTSEGETENKPRIKVPPNRENFYGAVSGVEIGTMYDTRMQSCADGVHRPTVAGIHGGPDGAYSIALSGGYEDDIDAGECFTYTGEGGRDLKGTKNKPKNLRTAPQSKEQTLTRGNLALSRNVETGKPVRVIRGYKLRSPYAPEEGYRYDGLYSVEKAWFTTGLSGFGVWKFALKRCDGQPPPPWLYGKAVDADVHAAMNDANSVNNDGNSVNNGNILKPIQTEMTV